MAKFPALPIWTDALIGDTYQLTPAEFGAYLRLLIAMWRSPNCRLKDDDILLGRIVGDPRNWKRIRPRLDHFLTRVDGFVLSRRLLDEYDFVSRKAAQASEAGKASALKRKNRDATDVELSLQRNANGEATPTPTPTPIKKVSKKEPSTKVEVDLPDYLPKQLWADFVEMRTRCRSKPTKRATEILLRKLEALRADGENPIAVVEQSIANSWKSLFPVHIGRKNGNGKANGNGLNQDERVLGIIERIGKEPVALGGGGDDNNPIKPLLPGTGTN